MIGGSAFIVGLVVLAGVLGSVLAAATLITRRLLGHLGGYLRVLAYAVVATSLLLAVHIVPGALGILSRWTVLALSVLALVCVYVWLPSLRPAAAIDPPAPTEGERRSSWVLAWVGAGLVTGYAVAYLHGHLTTPPVAVDALNFHLPDVARWITTGTFWEINQFVPALAHGNYPNNGDVIFLALILPFKSALLVREAMAPYLALTGLATYAIARELGSPRPASLLFAAALCSVPVVARPAIVDTQTDIVALFGLACGIAFMLLHRRSRLRSDLVLAGLALGVSFGTKWYTVLDVPAVVALWAIGTGLADRHWRQLRGQVVGLAALIAAAGGFWLLRNLVESANPFFPLKVAPFGITIFNAPRDVIQELGGFSVADYITKPHILGTYIWPALRDTAGWLGPLFAATVLIGGWIAFSDRRRDRRNELAPAVLLVCIGALLLAALYTIMPDTALGPRNMPLLAKANTRYLMPALVAAAPIAAWLSGRLGRAGLVLEVGGLGLTIQALSRVFVMRSGFALALTVIVVLAGGLWLRGPRARISLGRWLRPAPFVGLALLAAVAVAVWARPRFNYSSYAQGDATLNWVLTHAPTGRNVGLAGVWSNTLAPPFPAFGPRLGNRVTYVGPFVDHMLQQYSARRAFERALRRGRYDILFVGRGFPDPKPTVPDETWAEAAGYHEVARSWQLTLFVR